MNHNSYPSSNSFNSPNASPDQNPDHQTPSPDTSWDSLRADAQPIFQPDLTSARPESTSLDPNSTRSSAEYLTDPAKIQITKMTRVLNQGPAAFAVSSKMITPLEPREREQAYNFINSGQATPAYESNLLQKIVTPLGQNFEKTQVVLDRLNTPHERGILAHFSGRGFNNRDYVGPNDLVRTINQFPTPVEFNQKADEFIAGLRRSGNSEAKVQTYLEDLDTFSHKLYGKRREYHDALTALRGEAAAADTSRQTANSQSFLRGQNSKTPPFSPNQPSNPNQNRNLNQDQNQSSANFILGPVKQIDPNNPDSNFYRERIYLDQNSTSDQNSTNDQSPTNNQSPANSQNSTSGQTSPVRSETPLEDSLHYMSPEVAARYTPDDAQNQQTDHANSPTNSPAEQSQQAKPSRLSRLFRRK